MLRSSMVLALTLAVTLKNTIYTYISNANVVATILSIGSGEVDKVEGMALAIRKVGARIAS